MTRSYWGQWFVVTSGEPLTGPMNCQTLYLQEASLCICQWSGAESYWFQSLNMVAAHQHLKLLASVLTIVCLFFVSILECKSVGCEDELFHLVKGVELCSVLGPCSIIFQQVSYHL